MRSAWILLPAFAVALLLRGPLGTANAERRVLTLPTLPSPKVAAGLSFGHRSTAADSLWLRAIPDLSRRFARADESDEVAERRKLDWLAQVIDVVTGLEPKFHSVFTYGSAYLQLVAHEPERAIQVLERGVANDPDDLELQIHLGMALLNDRHDRAAALRVFQKIADHPHCDALSLGLCTKLMVDERSDVAALEQYRRYLEEGDEYTRTMAELYLERTKRHIVVRAFQEYKEREGGSPETLDALRDPSLMAESVMDEVLAAATLENGQLHFPRAEELEIRNLVGLVRTWSRQFRVENDRWPKIDDLQKSRGFSLPRLPKGSHLELREGELTVVQD